MTTDEFNEILSKIPNEELISVCEGEITDLAKSGGKTFRMSIPPSINDTDIILSELVERYKKLISC